MKSVSSECLSQYEKMNNKAASAPSKITSPAVMILIACSLNGHTSNRWRGGAVRPASDCFAEKVSLFGCVNDDILHSGLQILELVRGRGGVILRYGTRDCKHRIRDFSKVSQPLRKTRQCCSTIAATQIQSPAIPPAGLAGGATNRH